MKSDTPKASQFMARGKDKMKQNNKRQKERFSGISITKSVLGLGLFFLVANCGSRAYKFPAFTIPLDDLIPVVVNTPAQIAQESAENYDDNVNGLITARTLERFVSNWSSERPQGVRGNLHIFHVNDTTTGSGSYVHSAPSQGREVFTYLITSASSVFGQTRDNGIISVETMVLEGPRVESFLTQYGINPQADLIVFAPDTNTQNSLWWALRGWYTLRYWGVPARNLAVLNGAPVAEVSATFLRDSLNSAPGTGRYRIRSGKADNTALQIGFQELHAVVWGTQSIAGGHFLLDARSPGEFRGDPNATAFSSAMASACTTTVTIANSNPTTSNCVQYFEGTIKGAQNLPNGELRTTNTSAKFKTKAEIRALILGRGYQSGQTLITFCRTNVRSMVTGFAAGTILGLPTQYYDGSWVEWGSMTGDTVRFDGVGGASAVLQPQSSWRTDNPTFTTNLTWNAKVNVGRITPVTIFRSFSRDPNKIITDDKAFIRGAGSSGGGIGGTAGAGNPCGG